MCGQRPQNLLVPRSPQLTFRSGKLDLLFRISHLLDLHAGGGHYSLVITSEDLKAYLNAQASCGANVYLVNIINHDGSRCYPPFWS